MSGSVITVAIINGMLSGGVYSLTAVGLTLIWGVMGVANFAHGGFLMVGVYITYWLFTLGGIDPYIGLLAAMGIMFAGGWYIQKYMVNRMMDAPHYNQFLLFLGLNIFLENLALFLWPDYRQLKFSYQNAVISIGRDYSIELVRLLAFVIAIALTTGIYYFLKLTDFGKAIRATSQNKIGSQVVGINILMVNCATFAIGAACAAGAGAVLTTYYPTYYSIGNVFLLTAFVVTCLGGMGNLVGAMVGGLIIGICESLGSIVIPGGQKELVTYGIFLLILVLKPEGLFRFSGYWQSR